MKVKLKYVLLDRYKSKDSLCGISLRIGYKRKYRFQDTGIEVYKEQFEEVEAKKGSPFVVKNHPKKLTFNERLKHLQDKVFKAYSQMIMNDEFITIDKIKRSIHQQSNFAKGIFEKILAEDRRIEENTKYAIRSMIVRLHEYAPELIIDEIDYKFAKGFETWLRKTPSRFGKTLSVNSTNKYIRDLSRMLVRSIKYEYISINKLQGYDYIKEPSGSYQKRESLTLSELEKLENIDLLEYNFTASKKDSIQYTIDAFLFSCYSGLRLSDIMLVNKSHLKNGILEITDIKTNTPLVIPINHLFWGRGLKMLEHYTKHRLDNNPIFAERSRVTHQSNMTIIRSLIFPEKKISFHSARHTFATLLIEMGFKEVTVQKYLGHKSNLTTRDVYDHSTMKNEIEEAKEKFA